jgi:hypothetical protein
MARLLVSLSCPGTAVSARPSIEGAEVAHNHVAPSGLA